MKQDEIRTQFSEFAVPLTSFVSLGSQKDSVEVLAKNLWAAMLGGDEVEKELWSALEENGQIDANVLALVRRCFYEDMKPTLSLDQLAKLREHYGFEMDI